MLLLELKSIAFPPIAGSLNPLKIGSCCYSCLLWGQLMRKTLTRSQSPKNRVMLLLEELIKAPLGARIKITSQSPKNRVMLL